MPSTSSRTHSTRRIPSGWEASEPQQRRCGLCRGISHTRASLRCPVNIRRAREELRADSASQFNPESLPLPLPSLSPEPATQPVPKLADTRPIWPGRPELIYKRYVKEKEDWLRAYSDVQPAQYRAARGLEHYSKRWLDENRWYLGRQRLDLETETFTEPANWTDEEVEAFLDWNTQETIEVEMQQEVEFNIRGGLSAERGTRDL